MTNQANWPKGRSLLRFFFSFDGRINRSMFWLYWAIYIVTSLLMDRLITLTTLQPGATGPAVSGMTEGLVVLIGAVWAIAIFWSYLAVHVKRWHDRDKSGWWVLIGFVPIIGFIWTLIECGFLKGTEGDNRFGPDPLAPNLASVFD